jgi:hypothetical protein
MNETFEPVVDNKESKDQKKMGVPLEAMDIAWANPNKPIPAPKRPDHSAELAPMYSRISELREELSILESALRHKDPIMRTGMRSAEAVSMRVPKTELSYQESVDLYETREEILKELGPLEAERDRLEDEQYDPDEIRELRQARTMIEADKQDDPALGGYTSIGKPSAPAHYITRAFEKYHYYTGQWHVMQGMKWVAQKTGLTKIFKNLGASLDAFEKRMQAKLPQGDARKALPPGPNEKKSDDKR